MRGPVGSASAFLNELTSQNITIRGVGQKLFQLGYTSQQSMVYGHKPDTGEPCGAMDGETCMRGALIVSANPMKDAEILMRDVAFDVNLARGKSFSYSVTVHESVMPKTYTCNKGRGLRAGAALAPNRVANGCGATHV